MHQERVSRRDVREQILAAPRQRDDRLPLEPCLESARERPAQIRTPEFNRFDARAQHAARNQSPGRLDFRKFWHSFIIPSRPLRLARAVYSAVALAALALLLLGGWLLRSASNPAVEHAPAHKEVPREATPAAAQRAAADDHYDLDADEARGGHTLARHVGLTATQLRERLGRESGITTASTYLTREVAARTIARTLRTQAERVRAWSARSGRRPNLALDYRGRSAEVIGRSIRRGRDPVSCTDAVVVLRWHDGSYYVLTSYPEPAR
jgi:hypothetical protein